jgi:hypothetical protein
VGGADRDWWLPEHQGAHCARRSPAMNHGAR